jgi:uncharacterized protein YifE (UPF0438 family)
LAFGGNGIDEERSTMKLGFGKVAKGTNLSEKFQLKILKHTDYSLSWKQKRFLRKHGTMMKALMDGTATYFSPDAKHFVAMCQGLVKPHGEYELVWKSYLLTLEEEKRLDHCLTTSCESSLDHHTSDIQTLVPCTLGIT